MITGERSRRLPGDLPLSYALRLMVESRLNEIIVFGMVAGVAAAAASGGNHAVLATFLAIGAIAVLGFWSQRAGVAVRAENQPFLHGLVAAAAARIGKRAPTRVRLVSEVSVTAATRFGRPELRIGLPLVSCLTADQLTVLVAHALAVLDNDRPALICTGYARWVESIEDSEPEPPDGSGPDGSGPDGSGPAGRGLGAAVGRLGRKVAGEADATLTALCGAADAAWAIAVASTATYAYQMFVLDSQDGQRWGATLIEDLDAGWQVLLECGAPGHWWGDDEAVTLAALHPGLACELMALGSQPLELKCPAGRVRVEPLTRRERRRLVRGATGTTSKIVR
jgi:hypothetical protein